MCFWWYQIHFDFNFSLLFTRNTFRLLSSPIRRFQWRQDLWFYCDLQHKRVNCFPSTLNHLLSSSLLHCWINLNVILGRAALYRSRFGQYCPFNFIFFFFASLFWCFGKKSKILRDQKLLPMLREDMERICLFSCVVKPQTLWHNLWLPAGNEAQREVKKGTKTSDECEVEKERISLHFISRNFPYITISRNVSNCWLV